MTITEFDKIRYECKAISGDSRIFQSVGIVPKITLCIRGIRGASGIRKVLYKIGNAPYVGKNDILHRIEETQFRYK